MYSRSRVTSQLFTALVVGILLGSVVIGPAAAQQAIDEPNYEDQMEPADEVYITESGAVLVYSETSDDSDLVAMNFGADVTTGLVNAVIESEDGAEDVTGSLGFEAGQHSLSGDANLSIQNVEDLSEFSFSATGEHSRSDSYANASLTAEFEGQRAMTGETNGEIIMTSEQFSLATETQLGDEFNREEATQRMQVRIEESGDGFTADIEEKKQIRIAEQRWDSEENATRTLEQRYDSLVSQLGGTANVSLETYVYEPGDQESGATVDVSYTVALEDVRSGITDRIIEGIGADEMIDISEEERAGMKEALENLEVDVIDITYAQGPNGQISADATVEFSNYRSPLLTYMETVAGENAPIDEEQLAELRDTFAGQEAAGLQQQMTWDVSLTPADQPGTVLLEATARYDTENWEAFTEERYGDNEDDQMGATFDITAESREDDLAVDMTFQVDRTDLMDKAVDRSVSQFLGRDTAALDDDEMQYLTAFNDSEIQVAKSDIIFGEDTVKVTAAGQFANLSAFEQTADLPSDSSVSHLYGELSGEKTGEMYVYVENEGITADTVQDTRFADENTTVHAEGEWDRDFPRMDTEQASEYLGVELEGAAGGDDDETTDSEETGEESDRNLTMVLLIGGIVVAVGGGVVFFRSR